MPTYQLSPAFMRMHAALTKSEKHRFREAVDLFKEGLLAASGRFHPSLRVHRIDSTRDVWSLTWNRGQGRAVFRYGDSVRPGEPHIEWLGVTPDHSLYRG